jgi:hypothetical protein
MSVGVYIFIIILTIVMLVGGILSVTNYPENPTYSDKLVYIFGWVFIGISIIIFVFLIFNRLINSGRIFIPGIKHGL